MIVSVMYQIGAGNRFDLDYYMKTHIPLVDARWAPYGLKSVRVLRGIGTPSGDPAGHHIIALLDFGSLDAFKAAAEAHGAEVLGDVPKFTDVQPDIQFNEVVT
ncbi:MAG TPA: EthD family reductase [Rhodopila sp.]|jgi:uncharacterized protein (TIGR02118 family)|nr:EthD family reductase [Rhodopila sp.]